jgi:hypothetical protein
MQMMGHMQHQHTSFGTQDVQDALVFVVLWGSTPMSLCTGEVRPHFKALLCGSLVCHYLRDYFLVSLQVLGF